MKDVSKALLFVVVTLGVSASGKSVGEKLDVSFYESFKESKGKITFASCGPGEQSYEWEEKGHGIFTYYLVEGMRGAADEKGDNDEPKAFCDFSLSDDPVARGPGVLKRSR